MTGLEFRDVHDGDMIPAHCMDRGYIHAPSLFAWLCPSLTQAEAEALGRRAECMACSTGVAALRSFIEQNIESVRFTLAVSAVKRGMGVLGALADVARAVDDAG